MKNIFIICLTYSKEAYQSSGYYGNKITPALPKTLSKKHIFIRTERLKFRLHKYLKGGSLFEILDWQNDFDYSFQESSLSKMDLFMFWNPTFWSLWNIWTPQTKKNKSTHDSLITEAPSDNWAELFWCRVPLIFPSKVALLKTVQCLGTHAVLNQRLTMRSRVLHEDAFFLPKMEQFFVWAPVAI